MKIKMLTSIVCDNLIFSHGQVFDTNENINKELAEEFIALGRAKVIEEDIAVKPAKKKATSKKVKSDES